MLAESVNRFIAMASCTFPEPYAVKPLLPIEYEPLTALFLKAEELGIYNVFGDDESSDTLFGLFCKILENPIVCLGNWGAELVGFDTWGA